MKRCFIGLQHLYFIISSEISRGCLHLTDWETKAEVICLKSCNWIVAKEGSKGSVFSLLDLMLFDCLILIFSIFSYISCFFGREGVP